VSTPSEQPHGDEASSSTCPNPATSGPSLLSDCTSDQERRFADAFHLLEVGIAQRAFPGASLAITQRGKLLACKAFGHFTYADAAEQPSPPVTCQTAWDLASLTKPIATTSMAMLLWQREQLPLDARVVTLLPEFANPAGTAPKWRELVTVRMLLAHSSGLPAHRKLYLERTGRQAILAAALSIPLAFPPMTRVEYSDIGFLVFGELLERVAAESLSTFCQREVFAPLKLNFAFSPDLTAPQAVPPTVIDTDFRHRIVQGEVNDENASAMGGVGGHAGLFGDILSVATFAECLLHGGAPVFQPRSVELFTTRQLRPTGTSRALGWDTPSIPSQSGIRFSARSFGHLGYTGTSLWCDPERGLSVTLLTNRTWPDARNQAIKQVRPALHDAIVRALPKP